MILHFHDSEMLMQFQPETNDAQMIITGIAADHIVMKGTKYHKPLFFNHKTCLTDLQSTSFDDIQAHDLIRVMKLGHQQILIGTGNTHRWPTPDLKRWCDKYDLHIETMHNQALCYTFSLLAQDQPDMGFMLFFDAQTN